MGSEQHLLDLVLHLLDLGVKTAVSVAEDSRGNDVAGHTAGAAEISLLANVDVGNVLNEKG